MRIICIGLLAFGCASTHRQPPASTTAMASQLRDKDGNFAGVGGVGPKGKFHCEYETVTGSNIRKQICRYEEDADTAAHREETRQALRNIEVPLCLPEHDGGRCHAY
jgi:hypothetical protein